MIPGPDICFTDTMTAICLDAIDTLPTIDANDHQGHADAGSRCTTDAVATVAANLWVTEDDRDDIRDSIFSATDRLESAIDRFTDFNWDAAVAETIVGGLANGATGAAMGAAGAGVYHCVDHYDDMKDIYQATNDIKWGIAKWEYLDANGS
jgi:hypothetical protein